MAQDPSAAPASPCINVCQLDGRVCRGCGRHIDEIIEWSSASPARKHAIIAAARTRLKSPERHRP